MPESAKVFKYESVDFEEGKGSVSLCRTDVVSAHVQILKEGGDNNLHAHTGADGIWFVLGGCARVYEDEETVTAELRKHEGILIPHGVKYWFEQAGDEPLEIMHIVGRVPNVKSERINYTPVKESYHNIHTKTGVVDRAALTGTSHRAA